MAVAQIYGLKPVEVENALPRVLAAADFAAVAALARAISGAQWVCIRLADATGARVVFYPEREGVTDLPPSLHSGERSGDAGAEFSAMGLAGVQFWAGFPLRDAAGRSIGLMGVMDDVPRALSQGVIGQLQLVADVLADKVESGALALRMVARRTLKLIEDVVEVDDAAASPVLRGLLRFAAGDVPQSTEAMALRIAGLAEAKGGRLMLTPIAEGILAQQGIQAQAGDLAEAVDVPVLPVTEFSPMARLRIGETVHDIARSDALDALGFRPAGSEGAWTVLENGLEEGWPEIIAEVLKKTRNVVMEYVRMHMIHEREVPLPEGQYHYDLYGMGWTVRGTPEHAEVSVNGTDWTVFDASGVGFDQPRDLSARAAMAGYPDIGDRIAGDVHEWCKRLAAGSEVTPIF
ncbi:hypothetical protein [Paragemmobacter straminiformis]|uniref:GAF domain-containing protein n=1 Tax=Paragemmobacter straminiformis TaxID=2045119 RepID=A0A842I5B2_9RHOB|nr:hypothetical protein [Gemmobacter straminiformis]MBC2834819.1 hypothetical protein [Gemmobacter straminiformis]